MVPNTMHTPYLLWILLISILIPDSKASLFDEAEAIAVKGHKYGTTRDVNSPDNTACISFFSKKDNKFWQVANDSNKPVIFQVKRAKSTRPWGDRLTLHGGSVIQLPFKKKLKLNVRFPQPAVKEPQLTEESASDAPQVKQLAENQSGPKKRRKKVRKEPNVHAQLPRPDDEPSNPQQLTKDSPGDAPPFMELKASASGREQVSTEVRHASMSLLDQGLSFRRLVMVLFFLPLLFRYSPP